MTFWCALTVTVIGFVTNSAFAQLNFDCSKVSSDVEIATLMSALKFESPSQQAKPHALAVQKQRQDIVAKLGKRMASMTGSKFSDDLRYTAITFEEGSVTGVIKCDQESGLTVLIGSFAVPKHGMSGNL